MLCVRKSDVLAISGEGWWSGPNYVVQEYGISCGGYDARVRIARVRLKNRTKAGSIVNMRKRKLLVAGWGESARNRLVAHC
jgi:hypothetical protein